LIQGRRLSGRETGAMVLDDVAQTKNLKEDYKRFLKMKQQQHVKEFLEKFTDIDFL
jgi:hypothetical protein